MSFVAALAAASEPQVVDSTAWPGVKFRVRVISTSEAIAAGGIMEHVIGALVSFDPERDQSQMIQMTAKAAIMGDEHRRAVARVAVVEMYGPDPDNGGEYAWEPVKFTMQKPAPGDTSKLWVGILHAGDTHAIYEVAMGAAISAVAGARPFPDDGGRQAEHDDTNAGRDGAAVREAPDGAAGGPAAGVGEE